MADSNESAKSTKTGDLPEIAYLEKGPVPPATRGQAEEMLERLAKKAPRPLLFARVKITVDEGRDPSKSTIVQATLDISGELIRAQVSAPSPGDGLNTLADRIDRRLRKLSERRQDVTRRPASTPEGSWRRGDLPTSRPDFFPRPPEERRVVRRKTWAPRDQISVTEALFNLDVLDHRFFLFTDRSDGETTVVYEDGDMVSLQRLTGGSPPEDAVVPVNETPAPELDLDDAKTQLDITDAPFLFFRDPETGEGEVLYRRYDGHYGLIEPRR
jgi:ribosome-associated translation inhibitor RaiA